MHRSLALTVAGGIVVLASTSARADEPKQDETEAAQATLDESQREAAPPLPRGTPYQPSKWPWILGGAGIVAMATGGAFMLVSLGDRSKADDFAGLAARSTNPNEQAQLEQSSDESKHNADKNRTIGIVTAAAGGALLLAGVVWLILDRPPDSAKPAQARVFPFVDRGAAGLGIAGALF